MVKPLMPIFRLLVKTPIWNQIVITTITCSDSFPLMVSCSRNLSMQNNNRQQNRHVWKQITVSKVLDLLLLLLLVSISVDNYGKNRSEFGKWVKTDVQRGNHKCYVQWLDIWNCFQITYLLLLLFCAQFTFTKFHEEHSVLIRKFF